MVPKKFRSECTTCYAKPQDKFTFYEIDPSMQRIAENPKFFTFLQDCPAKGGIILGDARLKIAKAPDHSYDLIIIDAFSSDAVPVHLITKEAVELYLKKLKNHGMIAFNISNRYLRLDQVLAAITNDLNIHGLILFDPDHDWAGFKFSSIWVVIAQDREDLAELTSKPLWKPLKFHRKAHLWRDDFSNVLSVIR